MSTKIFSNTFRIAIAAAALCASSAEAKPRRVVITDFDGPRKLADSGHAAVVTVLGNEYDIVATKRWDDVKADAARTTHGPAVWQKAARAACVDAVVEGFINDEGRRHILTIVVREAATGNEVDQVTVRVPDAGPNADTQKQLQTSLDAVLDWIEPGSNGCDNAHHLDRAKPVKWIGAKADAGEDRVKAHDDSGDDDAPVVKHHRATDDDADDSTTKKARRHRPATEDDTDDAPPPPVHKKHRVSTLDDDDTVVAPERKIVVGSLEPADDKAGRKMLVDVFPPPADVIIEGADARVPHKPEATPRFTFTGGFGYDSRQLEFTSGDQTGPSEYTGTGLTTVRLGAEIYPWPLQKMDGRTSGLGFSAKFERALGATYTFDDGDTTADYTIDHTAYEFGVHYKWPLGQASIDTHLSYGASSHVIEDAPEELEVPDVSYSWLAGGADVELAITDRSSVSVGASYMYMLDAGDLTSEDWYGSGSTHGMEFHIAANIPLPQRMFLQGTFSYRRISTNFNGDGTLTQLWGVVDATDTSIGVGANIGVQF